MWWKFLLSRFSYCGSYSRSCRRSSFADKLSAVETSVGTLSWNWLELQLELAGKLSAGTSVETSVNWKFKLELQVNFQLYKRRRKIQSNGGFTSRCVSNTWRIACTSISSTSKSLVMNLLTLTMDIQILTMNFEC